MKLFTEWQVSLSAILGGPIPPGLLISHNFKTLGREREAYVALAFTLIFTISLIYFLLQLPEKTVDKIPSAAFSALYAILIFIFYRYYLAADVKAHLEAEAEKGSNWSVVGLTVLGLAINWIIIFGLAVSEPAFEGEIMKVNGNDLYYADNIPTEDINRLVVKLEENGFFEPEFGNTAVMEEFGLGYMITLWVDEVHWVDMTLISQFTSMKWLLEVEFSKPVRMRFKAISESGVTKYKVL